MPKSRSSYLMNMGRGLMKRVTQYKSRSPLLKWSPSSNSRSPAVPRGTVRRRKSPRTRHVHYRPFVEHVKNEVRSNRVRTGMNTNMFKNMIVQQRSMSAKLKKPLGTGF
jgi:hypothetical protein